jgi:hypothetical protein
VCIADLSGTADNVWHPQRPTRAQSSADEEGRRMVG